MTTTPVTQCVGCCRLQELVLGRIGSRLKSSWYFPPMQQQLLQAHQEEDGQAEQNLAAAEQAAAVAAGQAAEAVLAGVVSRSGSRLAKDMPAAGAAVADSAGASCILHSDLDDERHTEDEQQPDEQVAGAAKEEEVACVEVQVLLAGTASGKQQLQEHGLSTEQLSF